MSTKHRLCLTHGRFYAGEEGDCPQCLRARVAELEAEVERLKAYEQGRDAMYLDMLKARNELTRQVESDRDRWREAARGMAGGTADMEYFEMTPDRRVIGGWTEEQWKKRRAANLLAEHGIEEASDE